LKAAAAILLGLLLAAGTVSASPTAKETRSCAQIWSTFTVSLLGDRDRTWWANSPAIRTIPDGRAVVTVWSLGGDRGVNVYAWATAKQSRFESRCSSIKAALKPPDLAALRAPVKVKDGWYYGRSAACVERGPLLITVGREGSKSRVVVRMQRSGKVIAVADLSRGGGSFRGSKACSDRER